MAAGADERFTPIRKQDLMVVKGAPNAREEENCGGNVNFAARSSCISRAWLIASKTAKGEGSTHQQHS
jgi:hypothetical protein